MPQIPAYLAQRQLGLESGTPQAGAQFRTTPQPTAQPGAFTAGAVGIQRAGAALRDVGQVVQAYANRQQDAEDSQAIEKAKQSGLQAWDTQVEELHQQAVLPDPETGELPYMNPVARGNRALELGKDIMEERAQFLTPRQRGRFEAEFGQYLTARTAAVRHRAQSESLHYFDQEAENGVKYHTWQAINAPDQVQGRLHEIDARRVADEAVQAGVWTVAKRQQKLAEATASIAVNAVQVATAADPESMRAQLLAQSRGEPTRDELPLAPLAHLPALLQNATVVYRERLSELENRDRQVEHRVAKLQQQTAIGLQAQITDVLPSVETVPLYDQLLRDVNARALGGQLSEGQQTHLTGLIRTLRAVAVDPPQVNDPDTERRLTFLLFAADNPGDFADLRAQLVEAAPRLKRETWKGFLNQARERERADHWSNLPGVRAGRQTILGGDVTEATMVSFLRGTMQEAEQVRLRTALDVYTTQVEELARESTARANADAPRLALEIRRAYVDQPDQETKVKALPAALQTVTEPSIAADVIRQLPGTRAQKGHLWQRWLDAQPPPPRTPPGTPAPAPGARPRIPVP